MRHLTVRVAWHDRNWAGQVCAAPSRNAYCLSLDRVRTERNDVVEDSLAGRSLELLSAAQQPPCVAESGPFMNATSWTRTFIHPYAHGQDTAATHGHLAKTDVVVPPYSTFAVPYAWMLKRQQHQIEERIADPIPADSEAPFPAKWVFSGQRQAQLLDHVFGQLDPGRSLVMMYAKTGHPLDERHIRLVVGIGTLSAVDKVLMYAQSKPGPEQPMWDRLVSHTIRPDGTDGFLLPYQAYLAPTDDHDEDARRAGLVEDLAVGVDDAHIRAFSYGSEIAGPDVALATLSKALESVRLIREHAIAAGPWEQREEWLNDRIAEQWKERGAYPGLGAVLEGMGLRLGTALVRELHTSKALRPDEDPWPLITALLERRTAPPRPMYNNDLLNAQPRWAALPRPRRDLLMLMSRFDLTSDAATRWLDPARRTASTRAVISDVQLLENPYRFAELDLGSGRGDNREGPITVGTVDRGLLGAIPAPTPPPIHPPLRGSGDPRRVRAALVAVLRAAGDQGDTLLAELEATERVAALDLSTPLVLPPYSLDGLPDLDVEVTRGSVPDPEGVDVATVQLVERSAISELLTRKLLARATRTEPSLGEDWHQLLIDAIGPAVDLTDPRHVAALAEQRDALETVTTRRLSCLVGSAGTGKTSVLGALLRSPKLVSEGVLLLAPTGKARVRLSQAAAGEAMTVSQFLYRQGRYDGARQRPLVDGGQKTREKGLYTGKRTVVIDESSMLTEDDLAAVLNALNLGFVRRLILVGDPAQLAPIGAGRPFADLVALLDRAGDADPTSTHGQTDGALARLQVQLRAAGGSAALALAAWFTDDPQPVDADRILTALDGDPARLPGQSNDGYTTSPTGPAGPEPDEPDDSPEALAEAHGQQLAMSLPGGSRKLGDLELVFWKTPEQLRTALLAQLDKHLGAGSTAGMDAALHIRDKLVPFEDHSGSEQFQILSPVRMSPNGVYELNRLVQATYRSAELANGRRRRQALGSEDIVVRDKVICLENGYRTGWDHNSGSKVEEYLANGEVGLVASVKNKGRGTQWAIALARREQQHFYFSAGDGDGSLELAYALTVHKAQGSEFDTVLVVVPEASRLLSRELAYTALTRAKKKLVLLVQGDDPGVLLNLTSASRSETARRNTNLFSMTAVRKLGDSQPFAEHLRHRAADGTLVRSKSEVVILNRILERFGPGVFIYEEPLPGPVTGGKLRPDFTATTDAGDAIVLEHLGMLGLPHYDASWDWKRAWYEANGFTEGQNLFTTDERDGLSTAAVDAVLDQIAKLLQD